MNKTRSRFANSDTVREKYAGALSIDWVSRSRTIGLVLAAFALLVFGLIHLEFSPARMIEGVGKLGTIAYLMLPPNPETWAKVMSYAVSMGETLAIAILGTLLAVVIAFPLSFLAARNVMTNRILQLLSRRFFDSIRGVDTLVWALIWINVVGLGPFAGVLAIMTSDIGAFGKLFSEAAEAADRRPVEGIKSTGGSHIQSVRFGLIPQILPVIASQVLYYIESNTRSATIIGIVGAGGIGMHLSEQIRMLEWQQTSFIILMILVTVAMIDFVSTRIRFSIIGPAAR